MTREVSPGDSSAWSDGQSQPEVAGHRGQTGSNKRRRSTDGVFDDKVLRRSER